MKIKNALKKILETTITIFFLIVAIAFILLLFWLDRIRFVY